MHAKISTTMQAKSGKQIQLSYKEDNPDVVFLVIKTNGGTVTDTIEMPVTEMMTGLRTLQVFYERYMPKIEIEEVEENSEE